MSDVALSEEGDRRRCTASTSRTSDSDAEQAHQIYGRLSPSACETKCDPRGRKRTQNGIEEIYLKRCIAQRSP